MLVQHKKVAFHPNCHVVFEGEKIPHWELALEKVLALHKQLYIMSIPLDGILCF